MEKAIPELTAEAQLIIKNTNERPNKFQFVRLEDYGYTCLLYTSQLKIREKASVSVYMPITLNLG